MTIKSALSATGKGLLTATTVIANSTTLVRINEIDDEIARLQEEKALLERRLIG